MVHFKIWGLFKNKNVKLKHTHELLNELQSFPIQKTML